MARLIDVDEALRLIRGHVTPGPVVEMPLGEALWRTLAVAVACDAEFPPFDRSVMDGYAVRAEDVAGAPVTLRVVGQVPAGSSATARLGPGQAMQINTGAPIPAGADAVVRVEATVADDDTRSVLVKAAVGAGTFITRRGAYAPAGRTALEAGTLLSPAAVGVAATCGAARVQVYRQATVGVLSTGDELVEIAQTPSGAEIRNSNQPMLAALIRTAHAHALTLRPARDDRAGLRTSIAEGLASADMLCITGGVSMGAFDFVPEILRDAGAVFHVRKMAIKPGRPMIFAVMPDGAPVFALPGNPASAFVCFELFVRAALAGLEGRAWRPAYVRATLSGSLQPTRDRRSFIPVRAHIADDGGVVAETVSWGGSGDPFGIARANALVMRPPGSGGVEPGDAVSVMLLDRLGGAWDRV
ncbi:MAG: gephyrin-like molybdotransferase Glp [Phycisphaerae bacterium]